MNEEWEPCGVCDEVPRLKPKKNTGPCAGCSDSICTEQNVFELSTQLRSHVGITTQATPGAVISCGA